MPFKKDFLNLLEDFKAAITPAENARSGQGTDLVLTGHFRKMMRKGIFETDTFAEMSFDEMGREMDDEMETISPLTKDDVTENNLAHETIALGRTQTLRILLHIAQKRTEFAEMITAKNLDGETPAEHGQVILKKLTEEHQARAAKMNTYVGPQSKAEIESFSMLETNITGIKACQKIMEDATANVLFMDAHKNNKKNNQKQNNRK